MIPPTGNLATPSSLEPKQYTDVSGQITQLWLPPVQLHRGSRID